MAKLAPSGMLRVGGSELEYRMIGPQPDEAPTIVMLHEGLGSAALWGDFPAKLQAATGAHVQGGDYLGPQGLGEISGRSGPARASGKARDPKPARELWNRSIDLAGVDPGL